MAVHGSQGGRVGGVGKGGGCIAVHSGQRSRGQDRPLLTFQGIRGGDQGGQERCDSKRSV